MNINWNEIWEGWRNNLIPPSHLREVILNTSFERITICRECEFNSSRRKKKKLRPDEYCTICGCTLSAKTKCLSCSCPMEIPKWSAVVTEEQESEMQDNEDTENYS